MMKTLTVCLFIFCFVGPAMSQNELSLRFMQRDAQEQGIECYDIEVMNTSAAVVQLGNQNFRFYYNARSMRFLRESAHSYLHNKGFGDLRMLQAVHNSNASGFGNLDFSDNLGFVNFVIVEDNKIDKVKLEKDTWVKCVRTCFEVSQKDDNRNIVWARAGLTDGYATAFTAISVKKGDKEFIADINLIDLENESSLTADRMANAIDKN